MILRRFGGTGLSLRGSAPGLSTRRWLARPDCRALDYGRLTPKLSKPLVPQQMTLATKADYFVEASSHLALQTDAKSPRTLLECAFAAFQNIAHEFPDFRILKAP